MGSDPDRTYFVMSVWPIKNPCKAIGAMDSTNLTQMYCGLERLCGSKGEISDSDAFIICRLEYNFILVCRNTRLPSALLKSLTLNILLCQ